MNLLVTQITLLSPFRVNKYPLPRPPLPMHAARSEFSLRVPHFLGHFPARTVRFFQEFVCLGRIGGFHRLGIPINFFTDP